MKRFLVAVMFGLMAIAAQAEASFDQIEGLIQQKNYAAAASGLEGIIQNHPKSAKAFYAMAQAQAGLGNLEKANKALTIATGLNPTLDFAPEGSVKKLKDAITPQTAKIEYIEESHTVRNTILVMFVIALGFVAYTVYRRNQEAEEKYQAELEAAEEKARADREAERKRQHMETLAKMDADRKAELAAEAALKAHKNYGKAGFDPSNPDKLKTKKQLKDEADQAAEKQRLFFEAEAKREAQARADASIARSGPAVQQPMYTPQPTHTTVVNNTSSGSDLLTGVLIGNMISNSGHHHDSERVVTREVVREVPAPSRDSSWDDTPSSSSSRSSSWDDTPSRSSSSSSSWDSGSSSSSSSSSSWDSGSSSSSSDSSSSSSWD